MVESIDTITSPDFSSQSTAVIKGMIVNLINTGVS